MGSFLGRLDQEFPQRDIDVNIVEFEVEGGLHIGGADDACRSVVLPSHPPQFLAFGEGHLDPAVAAGNGAFDRDFSGHLPNITTKSQGGGFGHAGRVRDWRGIMAKELVYAASAGPASERSKRVELVLVRIGIRAGISVTFSGEATGRLLELSRQAQGDLGENSAESQQIVAAAELLGRLLLQDVERTDDGVSLKDGVSRDRMMSVHDPEMRHGHKSSSKRFDGHKAAIVVDTGTQLITAVEVLPGNAPDNSGALELVEEAMGGAAYDDRDTRQAFADAGRTLIARVPGRPNRFTFPRKTSILTWRRAPAPVRRGMLPGESGPPGPGPAPMVELTN